MARLFVRANNQRFSKDVAPVTAAPFTMAAWFRAVGITQRQALMWLGDKDVTNNNWVLELAGATAGDPIEFRIRDASGTTVAATTTGFSANTWHLAMGREASATDHRVTIDGGSQGTSSSSKSPIGADRIAIGRRMSSSPSDALDGRLAECMLWDVVLTADEETALFNGINPGLIRPTNLKGHWPVWGLHSPEIDLSNQNNALTVGGTGTPAQANHAPVMSFTRKSASVPLIEAVEDAVEVALMLSPTPRWDRKMRIY